jgi:hypothetical protein
MLNDEGVFARLIARVKALLLEDWRGHAGRRFQEGTQAISDFAEENRVRPKDLLEDGIELGRRKLTGMASQEHAAADKSYAEAVKAFIESEDKKIETELKKKSLEIEISKKHAETRKAHADASIAETKALEAQFDLLRKLTEAGMVLHRDEHGNLTLLPKPEGSHILPLQSIEQERFPQT